jgi:hypothetical protein
MIGWLIGLLAPSIGEKYAKPAAFGILGIVVALVLWGGKCAYDSRVISNYNQKQENGQLKRERKADSNLGNQVQADDAAAADRQKELENATHNIPDGAPSARQRAIACSELRREAKQRKQPEPTC